MTNNANQKISLISLVVTPANTQNNQATQLTATGTFSDGQVQNLSNTLAWSSSNLAIATVSATGLVIPLTAGSTTITASYSGVSATTTFTSTAGGSAPPFFTVLAPVTSSEFFAAASSITSIVAVGSQGAIVRSTDGVHFTPQTSGTTDVLLGVAYGNGKFVAVGVGGLVLTSPDGSVWTNSANVPIVAFQAIAYGNGTYLATDTVGDVVSSRDGNTWHVQNVAGSNALSSVAFSNGTFVVVGNHGVIFTSPDGVNFTQRPSGATATLTAVVAHGNVIVASGLSGTILTSTDGGATFSQVVSQARTVQFNLSAFYQNQFYVYGDHADNGQLLTSVDGLSFTAAAPADTFFPTAILDAGNGSLYGFGQLGLIIKHTGSI